MYFEAGHPDYKVAYSWDSDNQLAKLTVTQTQIKEDNNGGDSLAFDLKIPIGFSSIDASDAPKILTLRVHEKEQSFYFPLEKKPDFVSFDVGNYTLKTVTLDYPVPRAESPTQP